MDYTTAPGYQTDAQGRRRIVPRDLANNVPGTSATGTDVDALVCEVMDVIENLAGIPPNASDLTQLGQAILKLIAKGVAQLSGALEWQVVANVGNTSVPIPAWATRVELQVVASGGAGSDSNASSPASGSFAGGGGGAGGYSWGTYAVSAATSSELLVTVGAGGTAQGNGGASSVSYNGDALLTANGGEGGSFYSAEGSEGGAGGAASGGTKWNLTGGWGGDGQSNALTFSGYGADGPWGGGGRAGNAGGLNGTAPGAGGGGAYGDSSSGGAALGGNGANGIVLYRFLP